MAYVRGSLLRQKWSADPGGLAPGSSSEEEIEEQTLAEAVCSGELQRLAGALAGRAAIGAGEAEAPESENGPAATPDGKLARLKSLELSFRRYCESALTPAVVRAQIRASQTDWTRLDCRSVSFATEGAAREAALSVRADGRTLDEVAGDAKREIRREDVYIEDAPTDAREDFLSARKGEIIGPIQRADELLLYLVLEKVLPSEADESVVLRARKAVVARLVEGKINDLVKWRWRFCTAPTGDSAKRWRR